MSINKKIKLEEGVYLEEVQSGYHEANQLEHSAIRIKSEIEAFDYDDHVSTENGNIANIKLGIIPFEEITVKESRDDEQSAVLQHDDGGIESIAEMKQEIDDLQSHPDDNRSNTIDDMKSAEDIQIKSEITIEETVIEKYSEFENRKDTRQDSEQKIENQDKQKVAKSKRNSIRETNKQKNCKFCDFSCDSKGVLLEHNKTVHPNDCTVKCNSCRIFFKGKSELEKHITDKHQGLGSKCYICLAQYKKGQWYKHGAQCPGRLLFSCNTCEMQFVKKEGIFKHLEEHGVLEDMKESFISELRVMEPIASCEICDDDKAYSKDAHQKHAQENHGGCKMCCPRCKQIFKSYSARTGHMKRHCRKLDSETPNVSHQIRESVQKLESQKCAKQSNRSDNVDVHIDQPNQNDRSTSNNIWTESGIDEEFQIKHEITIEEAKIQENTNQEANTQKLCKFCDFSCSHPAALWKHVIKVHPNERTAFCSLCPASFKGAPQLAKHIDEEHQGLGNRCKFCTGQYKKRGWEQHVRICPGRQLFICSSCEKSFVTKEGLFKHLDQHDVPENLKESSITVLLVKEQILCCEICADDRAFRNDEHHKHVEDEHNGQRLRCTDCRKTFKSYSSLYSHIKRSCRIGLFRKRSAAEETLRNDN